MGENRLNAKCPSRTKGPYRTEIIKDRLYFVILNTRHDKPIQTKQPGVQIIDVEESCRYEPFYEDFGPFNLAVMHNYITQLNEKLHEEETENETFWHIAAFDPKKRVNSAFLMGAYMIFYMNMGPEEVFEKLTQHCYYTNFRDASTGPAQYTISLVDCFRALGRAKKLNFYDPKDFCAEDYEYYETVQHGDLNWIVPEKIVAFAGPMSSDWLRGRGSTMSYHEPSFYNEYFKALGVTTVIRLNHPCYEGREFDKLGIRLYNLTFSDGGIPDYTLGNMFLTVVEDRPGAVAIHCKAGLGRTGTMIGLYLMKWYKFTALEAIAWLRICRPASVIGQQQTFLISQQAPMWRAGLRCKVPEHKVGVYSRERGTFDRKKSRDSLGTITTQVTSMDIRPRPENRPHVVNERLASQGDRLRGIKNDRERTSVLIRRRAMSVDEGETVAAADSNANEKNTPKAGGKIQAKKSNGRKRNSTEKDGPDPADPDLARRRSSRLSDSRKSKSPIVR